MLELLRFDDKRGRFRSQSQIKFFRNYTKLAMLAIKSYVGKSKINFEKSYLKWGINPVHLVFYSDTFLTS